MDLGQFQRLSLPAAVSGPSGKAAGKQERTPSSAEKRTAAAGAPPPSDQQIGKGCTALFESKPAPAALLLTGVALQSKQMKIPARLFHVARDLLAQCLH